ncbi:hypothetical protein BJ742DRAFT_736508 [Cladochytrium replicatum]|nr:hypothetical protein BJ742DRAFT_736508 [Cladochytrium replicatum]
MNVLISGAGIAGPTLAYFLAKAGAKVTIVERSPTMLTQGYNIDLDRNAVAVVTKMGLLDELRRFHTTETGTQFVDGEGKPFAVFPVKEGTPSPTSEFEILRGDLAAVLYSATKDNPKVEYLFGNTVEKVVETVTTEDYDLLVAADGLRSNIRTEHFSNDSVTVIDKNLFVLFAKIPRIASDNDWWNVYNAVKSRTISTRPDPHGTIRAMLSLYPLSPEQRRLWDGATRRSADRMERMKLIRAEFEDAGMKKWFSSRIVCLGDAAYATTLFTGMGTTLAVLGSYILAGELATTGDLTGENRGSVQAALEAYEAKFRPYVEKIQNVPSFVPRVAHPETAVGRTMLRTVIGTAAGAVKNSWISKQGFGNNEADGSFKLPNYPVFG